jgi:hypothetical protein
MTQLYAENLPVVTEIFLILPPSLRKIWNSRRRKGKREEEEEEEEEEDSLLKFLQSKVDLTKVYIS